MVLRYDFNMKKSLGPLLIFGIVFIFSLQSYAQDVVDTVVEVEIERKVGGGQKEVFERAITKASDQFIGQLIGETKLARNQSVIKNRIVRNSGKYILFIKARAPVADGDTLRYGVNMRVSMKSLEAMLLQEGLLYKSDGPPKVLPVVSFSDRVNSQSYSWWAQAPSTSPVLADLARKFNVTLRSELRSKGFFGLEPVVSEYRLQLPQALMSENPGTEDLLLMSEYYRAQVVAKGQVVLSSDRVRSDVFKVDVRLSAIHASNGRIIGEVIRSYTTEPGPFQQVVKAKVDEVLDKLVGDLSVQILEAWKSGTFGASLLNVAVNGELSYQQLNQFKRLLLDQVKDLKTLKERRFEPGRVIFETDSSSGAVELADSIKGKSFPRFQVNVTNVESDSVELKVVPR